MSIPRVICDGNDRSAWLAKRRLGVCASDVPILFGCGYSGTSLLQLYLDKIGESYPVNEDEGMSISRRLEGPILDELAERAQLGPRGDLWVGNKALWANDDHPFLMATPDGLTSMFEPIEVKNICHHLNDEEWEGTIPRRFMLQKQSQIAVCDSSRGLFGALLFGGRLVWSWIPRDDAMIAEIDRKVAEFWNCVATRTPPPSDGSASARKASLKIAEELPPVELFESDMLDLLSAWKEYRRQEQYANGVASAAKASRTSLEDELILRMGSAKRACTATGWEFAKTVTHKKAYTVKESTIEGFRVKPPKE